MYINKSLSFLEQTVIALADSRRDHVPFRQTKLTHCLKDSIGGGCNTLLIANIWGEAAQIEETVSVLFSHQLKSIEGYIVMQMTCPLSILVTLETSV